MDTAPSLPAGPDDDADLDLRLVRYFTVVAETLNFSRAAAKLHVAQPALSRQIQRLEAQLGVQLFDRTPQGSRLTEAGEVFLAQARALLRTARQALQTTRAAGPAGALTIGYVGDLTITAAVRELRRRHPGARVRARHLAWNETRALTERHVDALVTRIPLALPMDGLCVTELYQESRVLVVPSGHRLVGKEIVTLDDIADEELNACTESPAIWSTPRPVGALSDGADPGAAPAAPGTDDSFEDKLELVAGGYSIGILPAGDRRSTLRSDLVSIPIEGIEPCRVVLVTAADDENPLLPVFSGIARA